MAMMPQASSAWAFAVGLSNLTLRELIVHLGGEFFRLPADDLHDLEVQLLPARCESSGNLAPAESSI
jgi:hypothetical protein